MSKKAPVAVGDKVRCIKSPSHFNMAIGTVCKVFHLDESTRLIKVTTPTLDRIHLREDEWEPADD